MSPGAEPRFLSLDEVFEIQARMLEAYGGQAGVRDRASLESAVGMPTQTFGGVFVHADLFEMAAAYAFHIAENQPFVDGNKRDWAGSRSHLPHTQRRVRRRSKWAAVRCDDGAGHP